jgi:hypothetical protein
MYPRASIASFPRSVQSTPNPLTLRLGCLTHPALTIKSIASKTYSSGVLDSFGIGEGKRFLQYFLRPRWWGLFSPLKYCKMTSFRGGSDQYVFGDITKSRGCAIAGKDEWG